MNTCITVFSSLLKSPGGIKRPVRWLLFVTSLGYLMVGYGYIALSQGVTTGDTIRMQMYNQRAMRLMNTYDYEGSLKMLDSALMQKSNAVSYYYMEHIYTMENQWGKGVEYGEKAVQFDPQLFYAYTDLFYALTKVNRWKDAQKIADNARKGDANGYMAKEINGIDSSVDNANRSTIVIVIFLLLLAGVFLRPYLSTQHDSIWGIEDKSDVRLTELLLVGGAVSCVLYAIFFACSQWIWSQNPHPPLTVYSLAIRMATLEHDGVESFVMYVLVFANLLLTLLGTIALLKIRTNRSLYLTVSVFLLIATGYFFLHIGFFPPFPTVDLQYISTPIAITLLSISLFILYRYNSTLSKVIAILLAAFVGLLPPAPPSLVDDAYILDPALRLIHGFRIPEIYFQYDLFLSFIAYAWLKCNFLLDAFPFVGNIGFFLFFVGIFFFSDKYFHTRGLSILFIIGMFLVRVYTNAYENPITLQVSPLRLDLWLILLLVARYKGVHHWLVGMCIGLLVLFHRNLGLIYMMAYIELLVVLFIVDILPLIREKKLNGKTIWEQVVRHLRMNMASLLLIASSFVMCILLFHELFSKSALDYRKIGINFLPVSRVSFYWNVPIVLGCLGVLLFKYYKRLTPKYSEIGFFIVLLTVGNSMYFFGRSHENNVLNISGILLLSVFLLFDILIFLAPKEAQLRLKTSGGAVPVKNTGIKHTDKSAHKGAAKAEVVKENTGKATTTGRISWNIYLLFPIIFIVVTSYYYAGRTTEKIKVQYNNLLESNFYYQFPQVADTATARQLTHNSKDVFFMNEWYDFYYYYYGKYTPQGYHSPFCTWVYKEDIVKFIQDLLDRHYYIVYINRGQNDYFEYLSELDYNHQEELNGMVAISKVPVPLLLPSGASTVYHAGFKDSLIKNGIDRPDIDIKGDFTMEFIVKPIGGEPANAMIINNLSQFAYEGLKGFTFQLSGNTQDQYLFGFSNGRPMVPYTVFHMDANRWHYVAVTGNKDFLKIYEDGKLVGSVPTGGQPDIMSELPITIGNRNSRDAHFNGLIREVSISNGNIDDAELISRGQKIDAELNGSATPANP